MAKYKDPTTGQVIEVSSPELNPDLVAGKTLVPDTTPLGVSVPPTPSISSSILNPPATQNFQSPATTPTYPVGTLNTQPLVATGEEKKASELSEQLRTLSESLVGESAFRTSQEEAQKIPELQKTQTDLSARLKALQNEAAAIPLQLQQESTGRGVTAGGLAPIQAGELRKNAIAALGVSSLLEASRGNLSLALDLVDRAVAAEFDPIREEINAKRANLELVLNDPLATLSEKNRAQAQKDIQDTRARTLEAEKAEQENIYKIALEAAKSGADALTLRSILAATTRESALDIASQAGVLKEQEELKTQVVEVGGRKKLVNTQTGDIIKDLGVKDAPETPSNSGLFSSVVNGFTPINDLTPTQRQKVRDELFAAGFDSDTPPAWFREYIESELKMNLLPLALQEEWVKYRDGILGGGSGGGSGDLDFDNL